MTLQFTSTGTFSQSRARTTAYYAFDGGKCVGMVRRLQNGKWFGAAMVDGRIISASRQDLATRLEAGKWCSEQASNWKGVADAS